MIERIKHYLEIAAIAGVLFLGWQWYQGQQALAALDAQLKASKVVVAAQEQAIAARNATLDKTVAQLEAERKKPRNTREVVKYLPTLVDLPTPVAEPLPDAPSVVLPKADLAAITDKLLVCKEDAARLATCQGDLKSKDLIIAEKDKDVKLAVKAAKGSWLRRSWDKTKWLVIGAGSAYAACRVSGKCK